MFKSSSLLLALAVSVYTAEISLPYASLKPESTEALTSLKEVKPDVSHPVYREEKPKVQGRARIEPVRPLGPVVNHDVMLGDQPPASTDANNRVDLGILNGYQPSTAEVAYPDVPYAPGYYYDNGYSSPNTYDMYGADSYLMEPVPSTFDLLWSQVPYGRTLVSYAGRTILWIFDSLFVLFLGSLLTVGVCSYTNLCSIAFHGVGPIHEEMRALMSPERLEKISHAADFVKTAIDKYQKIQKVTKDSLTNRKRRAIFNY